MPTEDKEEFQFWDNPNSPNYNLVHQGLRKTFLERAMPYVTITLAIFVAILLPLAISNHVKISNNEEAVLETLKRIKPIIDQSKSGFKGQPGPPGPKGDPAPMPSGPITKKLPDTLGKNDQTVYKVECLGSCRLFEIALKVDTGDADLYIREDLPIVIENSDCDNCLCKSRQGGLTDECEIKSIKGQSFFVMVVTHKPHKNGTVIFSGMNLLNVTETESDN